MRAERKTLYAWQGVSRIIINCVSSNAGGPLYSNFRTTVSVVTAKALPPTSGTEDTCRRLSHKRASSSTITGCEERTVFAGWEKSKGWPTNQNISLFRLWHVLDIHAIISLKVYLRKATSLLYIVRVHWNKVLPAQTVRKNSLQCRM